MKKMIIAILLFFVAVFWMLNTYFSDLQINKYPTLQAVKDDKAIERGWVPGLLPDSAYDIEETHDLDSNQLFGKFYYKEPDEKKLLEKITSSEELNGTYEWGAFYFKVDTEKNEIKYRNKPNHSNQSQSN